MGRKTKLNFVEIVKFVLLMLSVSTLHSNGFIAPPAGEMFVCKLQGKKTNGDDVLITGLCCGDGLGSQIWAGDWMRGAKGGGLGFEHVSQLIQSGLWCHICDLWPQLKKKGSDCTSQANWSRHKTRMRKMFREIFFCCLITKIIEARFLHRRDWLAPLTHTLDSSRHLQRRAPKSY